MRLLREIYYCPFVDLCPPRATNASNTPHAHWRRTCRCSPGGATRMNSIPTPLEPTERRNNHYQPRPPRHARIAPPSDGCVLSMSQVRVGYRCGSVRPWPWLRLWMVLPQLVHARVPSPQLPSLTFDINTLSREVYFVLVYYE